MPDPARFLERLRDEPVILHRRYVAERALAVR
jgi:hypothetical protein